MTPTDGDRVAHVVDAIDGDYRRSCDAPERQFQVHPSHDPVERHCRISRSDSTSLLGYRVEYRRADNCRGSAVAPRRSHFVRWTRIHLSRSHIAHATVYVVRVIDERLRGSLSRTPGQLLWHREAPRPEERPVTSTRGLRPRLQQPDGRPSL